MPQVDITGIDRWTLLRAMWENMKPASFFMFHPVSAPSFEIDEDQIHRDGYVDYYRGRCIKTKVFGESNIVDSYLYNRDAGTGALERIVEILKSSKL
jgi:hypothetical protein